MGQIVKKKKKGRPSKADLAARAAATAARAGPESNAGHSSHRRRDAAEVERREARRSLRRRSFVRYNLIDYDEDYLDDDDDFELEDDDNMEEEDDGGRKREKKLKFVLKLPNCANRERPARSNGGGDSVARGRGSESEGEEEDEEEEEIRVFKKRKINEDLDEEDDDCDDNDDEEERGGKGESYKVDFDHGTTNDVPSQTPMPEKKRLELVLDKLQKKDAYGVYAEPVDPEELPDYHDIIKHPMDFATVRKKLADGAYSIFEQFESDVYLICSNAMKYNDPDTVYHKQARTIKELAQKKFQRVRLHIERLRIENERTEKEANSEQKMKPNPIVKKQMKRPIGRSTQDPVSSDFSYGAPLATTDAHNTSNGVQSNNYEIHSKNEGLVEGASSLPEENVEKVEDFQSGKAMTPPRLGRKPLVVDDNRRGTYEISNQPVDRSESIFSTFEGEDKQLIPVGLYGEHSCAQSLARFAATLGPVAWRTASKRIEQALPSGSKFGRGWVMEYEPVLTPVLYVAGQSQNEYSSIKKPQCPAVSVNTDMSSKSLVSSSEQLGIGGPSSNGKRCFLPSSGGSRPATPSGAIVQQQNPFVRKLQNATIPVKGDKPSKTTSANDLGENRPVSNAKQYQVPSLGGSRPATTTGASSQQQHPFVRKLQNAFVPAKTNELPESFVTTSGRLDSGSISEGKSSILPNSRGSRPSTPTGAVIQPQNAFVPAKTNESPESFVTTSGRLDSGSISEGKSSILPNSRGSRPSTPIGAVIQPQNPFSRNNSRPDNMVMNRVEVYTPTVTIQQTNPLLQKHYPSSAEMTPSWQLDTSARNRNFLQSAPRRPPSPASEGVVLGRFPNGNVNGSVDINRMASPSRGFSPQVVGTKTSFPPRQEQGLSDPVQAMRLSAENAQKQQNKMNNILGPLQTRPSIQSPRGDGMSGATTSAGAWMHASTADINRPASGYPSAHSNQISPDSLHNRTWEIYPQILQSGEYPVSGTRHFQPERSKVPFEELDSNPAKASNEAQFQNKPMAFPQLLVTDPSRIPMQSPRQGLTRRTEQKKKRDTLPPDLNVAFQSSVDPQQPDLALQL